MTRVARARRLHDLCDDAGVKVPGLARVTGRSMEPTLHQGDLLLVVWGAAPRIGALSVVELPPTPAGQARPLAVKRVTGTDPSDPSRWWVERDNPDGGVDSWTVGSLPRSAVRARVVCRLPRLARRTG